MYVLYACVVHTSGTTSCRVQSTLEHGSENGRRNKAPVKVIRCPLENQFPDLIIDARNLDIACKHSSVHIRECSKVILHILVPVLRLGVQNLKQFNQRLAEVLCLELLNIVVKHILGSENPGILGIQAEYQTDTQLIQTLL